MRPLEDATRWDPFLIAEIGVNHEGDLDRARRMVRDAAAAGVDAVKFQSYTASSLARADSPAYWDLDEEPTTNQRELFSKYDSFTVAEYAALAEEAAAAGVHFMSTPFDLDWVEALTPLVGIWKIASADITNRPLLRAVAATGYPVILSTGAATRAEIAAALDDLAGVEDVTLLHCVLRYPCEPEHANIATISALRSWFDGVRIGYSDHVSPDADAPVRAPVTACALHGAVVVEKHFTDDTTAAGNDHYHAWDGPLTRQFRRELEAMAALVGEQPVDDKDVTAEEDARRYARRGITAARPIAAGTRLTADDLVPKRPADGAIPVEEWDEVMGRTASRLIPEDSAIDWSDLA